MLLATCQPSDRSGALPCALSLLLTQGAKRRHRKNVWACCHPGQCCTGLTADRERGAEFGHSTRIQQQGSRRGERPASHPATVERHRGGDTGPDRTVRYLKPEAHKDPQPWPWPPNLSARPETGVDDDTIRYDVDDHDHEASVGRPDAKPRRESFAGCLRLNHTRPSRVAWTPAQAAQCSGLLPGVPPKMAHSTPS